MDRGLAYAEACFETFRVIRGEIFAWPAHAARLRQGLGAFALCVSNAQIDRMRAACVEAAVGLDALVRLTVSGGNASWGLFARAPQLAVRIQAMPYDADVGPVVLTVLDWPSPPIDRMAKFTADYASTLRALRGERSALFAHRQHLVSAATANVMILRHEQWWTPSLGAGVLAGVIRRHLIESGSVREGPCPVAWLDDCAALALTASSFFVRPLAGLRTEQGIRRLEDQSLQLISCLADLPGVPADIYHA